jgi:proteasome lid subunit RPN8/RPN11
MPSGLWSPVTWGAYKTASAALRSRGGAEPMMVALDVIPDVDALQRVLPVISDAERMAEAIHFITQGRGIEAERSAVAPKSQRNEPRRRPLRAKYRLPLPHTVAPDKQRQVTLTPHARRTIIRECLEHYGENECGGALLADNLVSWRPARIHGATIWETMDRSQSRLSVPVDLEYNAWDRCVGIWHTHPRGHRGLSMGDRRLFAQVATEYELRTISGEFLGIIVCPDKNGRWGDPSFTAYRFVRNQRSHSWEYEPATLTLEGAA